MIDKKWAPPKTFQKILEYAVIPTFDLIIEYGTQGILIVRRKIAPYNNVWALPGLRMLKGESIDQTLIRIAKSEVGLEVNPQERYFIGQYVGKFKAENQRQDLSTGYLIKVSDRQKITINPDHFSDYKIAKTIPTPIGAMYKYFLQRYFSS